jgi:hypothetical protein
MLIVILIIAAVGVGLVALARQKRSPRLRQIAGGLLITYTLLVGLLAAGEFYFRFVFAESENVLTLATDNWLARHWHLNGYGYRDWEWSAEALAGKTVVVVTGDSFTAGWGIENPRDRYTDVLAVQLGDEYAVLNMGVYGTATAEQLELLREYPLGTPDVVILQYFLNDINYTGLRLGLLPEPKPLPALARESYLVNFVYTRLSPIFDPELLVDWWEWSYNAYDNVGIWSLHRQEIEDYISYVEGLGARLIVVIFPNMLDPVRSVAYIDRVAQVFEARGHTDILKLFDAAAAWPLESRIVSRRDTHPSIAFHRYVGETLYQQFFVGQED